MNKLTGIITQIQQSGAILLVDVEVDGHHFSALIIDSLASSLWIKKGNSIDIVFKETEVLLAKRLTANISIQNRMTCVVQNLERGVLLSKITLLFQKYMITSAITTRAFDSLQIVVGDEIEALINANEIALVKI